jgi:hypothetical protein
MSIPKKERKREATNKERREKTCCLEKSQMLQKSPKMILNPLQTPEISTINIIPDLMM